MSTANRIQFQSFDAQEVIEYCESRLRAAYNAMERADDVKADWIYDGMISELVSTSRREDCFNSISLIHLLAILPDVDWALLSKWPTYRYPHNYALLG